VSNWPPEVERVAQTLRDARVESRIEAMDEQTATAADAAKAVGCGLAQIVKSLLFSCDDKWVLAMVPGDRRADRVKIAALVDAGKASTAGPGDVSRVTGYPPGGVAPFPLPGVHAVFMEQTMLSHDLVWIGAGSPRHVAALTPADLVRVSRARTVDLVSEN
jgi:prolyl-tRNA editing enzyme YbaK/EbsC (Cys-tRNA(Pro) deacylase)